MSETGPNCYECKWRRGLLGLGDSCSRCVHPCVRPEPSLKDWPAVMAAATSGAYKESARRLGISADPVGLRGGWFLWPVNFDPAWLLTCTGFEHRRGIR